LSGLITLSALILACGVRGAPLPQSMPGASSRQPVLEAIKSQVNHLHGGIEKLVAEGQPLPVAQGDGVTVDTAGLAMLNFPDVLSVRIFRDSSVALKLEGIANPAMSAAEAIIHLHTGAAFGSLNDMAKRRLSVQTKWAIIEVTGTEFWIYYHQPTETTWVVVVKGKVNVTDTYTRATVTVHEKFQTWVKPMSPPEPPVPATRPLVGGLFPLVDDLTNAALGDGAVLDNPQCTVRIEPLTLHQSADRQSPIVDTMAANNRFEAVGRSLDGASIQGLSPANIKGWIEAAALTCAYDVQQLPIIMPTPVMPSPTAPPPPPPPLQPPFVVTDMKVTAAPASSTTCPTTIQFAAQISTSGAGALQAQWESSDGFIVQAQPMTFQASGQSSGSVSIYTSRTFDQPITGWMRLRILSPYSLASNQAEFAVSCPAAPQFIVTNINAAVKQASVSARCPARLDFVASVEATAAGSMSYRWVGSDGFASEALTLDFKNAGRRDVAFNRSFKDSTSGWMQIQVLKPNQLVSNPVDFALQCVEPPQPPQVTFVAHPSAITVGDCAVLRWNTNHVAAVYLMNNENVALSGERQVCPAATTVYSMLVILNDGSSRPYQVTVNVNPRPGPSIDDLVGLWVNIDKSAQVWKQLEIREEGDGQLVARTWQTCRTGSCDGGVFSGRYEGSATVLRPHGGSLPTLTLSLSGETLQVVTHLPTGDDVGGVEIVARAGALDVGIDQLSVAAASSVRKVVEHFRKAAIIE
jgi:hypothetical protein